MGLRVGVVLLSCSSVSAAPEKAFVPGEVIVRFRDGSPGAEAVLRAAGAEADVEKILAAQLRLLSDDAAVPLRFKRLAAGGDLLLAVDRERLEERLLGALRAADRVERCELLREGPGRDAPPRGIQVSFVKSSPEAQEVGRAAARPEGGPLGTLEATHRLQSRVGQPLVNRLTPSGELVVEPDLEPLTREIVRRLSARSDVEYAQPNYVVRRLRP